MQFIIEKTSQVAEKSVTKNIPESVTRGYMAISSFRAIVVGCEGMSPQRL